MPQSTLTDAQREALLTGVMTSAEIAQRYHMAPESVTRSIALGYIRARRSGRVWLLLTADCDRRWGYRLTLEGAAHE